MSKLSEDQIKNISKEDLFNIINKSRNDLRNDLVVQEMFEKYEVDIDEIDLIPIAFKDLDVSARTEHGIIYLNNMLLADGDFESNYHYLVHEMTHFLQQTTGNAPTQGSTEEDYLDNESEQEGFQNQTKYISLVDGPEEAEEYIEKVLDHHEIPDKEREQREDKLLSIASKKIEEQIELPFDLTTKEEEITDRTKLTPFEKRTRSDFLKELFDRINNPDAFPPVKRPNQQQLHLPVPKKDNKEHREEVARRSKEVADAATSKNPIKRRSWDENGNENRVTTKDLSDSEYNPNQLKLQLRDFSQISLIEKYFKDTTAEERNKLKRLILDDESSMGMFLNSYKTQLDPKLEPLVIIAKENSTERFLGWVLLQPREIDVELDFLEIDTMVDRSVRNEGLGSYLLIAAKKLNQVLFGGIHLEAGRWNNVSSNFYMKNELLPGEPEQIVVKKTENSLDRYPDYDTYHLPFDETYSELNKSRNDLHQSRLQQLKEYEENLKRYTPILPSSKKKNNIFAQEELNQDDLYKHSDEFATLGDH